MYIPYQLMKTRQDELLRTAARDRLTRPGPAKPPPAAAPAL